MPIGIAGGRALARKWRSALRDRFRAFVVEAEPVDQRAARAG